MIHAYSHKFCDEIHFSLKNYLLATRAAWPSGPPLTVPFVLWPGMDKPPGYQHFATRGKQEIGYAPVPAGVALTEMVLSQYEELFVDFVCAAAAGAAYWTTMFDFETGCTSTDRLFCSRWTVHQPYLYDPHPIPAARLILLPQMFLQVFAEKDGLGGISETDRSRILKLIRDHVQRYLLSRLPSTNKQTTLTYENPDGPSGLQKISVPFESLVPFYYAVCRCYRSLGLMWMKENHPLSVFSWWFFSTDYHRRILDLVEEFAKTTPRRIPDYFFDSIAGATAARIVV